MQQISSTFPDIELLSAAEQMARDYLDFLKNMVMPKMAQYCDLNLRELRVLSLLDTTEAVLSSTKIAEILRQDKATITRSMVILIQGDFVKTTENPQDARSRHVHLTQNGQQLATYYQTVLKDAIERTEKEYSQITGEIIDKDGLNTVLRLSKRAAFFHQTSVKEKRDMDKNRKAQRFKSDLSNQS